MEEGAPLGAPSSVLAVLDPRRRLRHDPRYEGFAEPALAGRSVERPVGVEPGRGGWWRVGRVVDGIAETELEVWCEPAARRIGLREREWGTFPAPRDERIVFDGERRCWIYRDTRDPVPAGLLKLICGTLGKQRSAPVKGATGHASPRHA